MRLRTTMRGRAGALALAVATALGGGCHASSARDPSPAVVTAVSKVKNLLVGLAATADEARAVEDDPAALQGLVAGWMETPQYREKMRRFFVTAFQQDGATFEDFAAQYGDMTPFKLVPSSIVQNFSESFARTVMELIAEGEPFTSAMTTHRFMMTPALLASYAVLDAIQVDDAGVVTDLFQRNNPVPMTLESSVPVPIEEAVDRNSPYFMTFYDPSVGLSYQAGCPESYGQYPAPVPLKTLSAFLYDFTPEPFTFGELSCDPPQTPAGALYVKRTDFSTWRMVTIRPPNPGETTLQPYDLPAMRAGRDAVLNTPRVGFFTTPRFLARWNTNASNQARVTLNQTLIVALGQPVDLANPSMPADTTAVESPHAQPGTTCYACHVSMDPMRQYFRQSYSLTFSRQTDPAQTRLPGQFAFHGVTAEGGSLDDFARLLANHPAMPAAWVQRLCTYASSAPCDDTSPEFARLVEVFRSSGYSWNALVQALFSSPLVTYLPGSGSPPEEQRVYPAARQSHLCSLLSARLGIDDVCGLDVDTQPVSYLTQAISQTWPSDAYSRGSAAPVLANDPSLFLRGGIEAVCADLSRFVVDGGPSSKYSSAHPEAAIGSFVTELMGVVGERGAALRAILDDHFTNAQAAGASPTDALRSTFVLACTSPLVVGIGQ